jgi:hypothetical protein
MAGRPAGPVDIQEAAFPGLESADEFAQPSRERRRSLGRGHGLAFPIDERDAARAGARQVGGDSGGGAPVHEAGPGRCRRDQVLQVLPLRVCDVGVVGVGGAGRELRHVELERGIVGQSGEFIELPIEPIVDGRESAVGDDAEAHLPGPQLALPLAVDEADDQGGAADRQHQQHRGRGKQRHVGRAYRTAPGRIRWWLCCHFINPRLIKNLLTNQPSSSNRRAPEPGVRAAILASYR